MSGKYMFKKIKRKHSYPQVTLEKVYALGVKLWWLVEKFC